MRKIDSFFCIYCSYKLVLLYSEIQLLPWFYFYISNLNTSCLYTNIHKNMQICPRSNKTTLSWYTTSSQLQTTQIFNSSFSFTFYNSLTNTFTHTYLYIQTTVGTKQSSLFIPFIDMPLHFSTATIVTCGIYPIYSCQSTRALIKQASTTLWTKHLLTAKMQQI